MSGTCECRFQMLPELKFPLPGAASWHHLHWCDVMLMLMPLPMAMLGLMPMQHIGRQLVLLRWQLLLCSTRFHHDFHPFHPWCNVTHSHIQYQIRASLPACYPAPTTSRQFLCCVVMSHASNECFILRADHVPPPALAPWTHLFLGSGVWLVFLDRLDVLVLVLVLVLLEMVIANAQNRYESRENSQMFGACGNFMGLFMKTFPISLALPIPTNI